MTNNKPSTNTELAKERNRAAAERTLMAWIRTCLSLISFGFGVDRIVTALQQSVVYDYIDDPPHLTRILGLSFIGIGTCAIILAALEHRQELYHIQHENYRYKSRSSLALVVAISIFFTGLFAFVGILIKTYSN
ncbi:MAG: YidH family protein [Pleurocapsa sp.]